VNLCLCQFNIKHQTDSPQDDCSTEPSSFPNPTSDTIHQELPHSYPPVQELLAQPKKRKTSIDTTSLKKRKLRDHTDDGWKLQDRGCREYRFWGVEAYCISCAQDQSKLRTNIRDNCRFIRFRWFKVDNFDNDSYILKFNEVHISGAQGEGFDYLDWMPAQTASHKNEVKVWLLVLAILASRYSPPS
jgi:hypothetical protein